MDKTHESVDKPLHPALAPLFCLGCVLLFFFCFLGFDLFGWMKSWDVEQGRVVWKKGSNGWEIFWEPFGTFCCLWWKVTLEAVDFLVCGNLFERSNERGKKVGYGSCFVSLVFQNWTRFLLALLAWLSFFFFFLNALMRRIISFRFRLAYCRISEKGKNFAWSKIEVCCDL